MRVRAKFFCHEIGTTTAGPGKVQHMAKLMPVYGDTGENRKFWEATPSGSIELACTNDQYFEVGKEYYVDFTPVE